MDDTAPVIPIRLVEVALKTAHAAALMTGRETHVPALHFVGELVPFTQDVQWIREILAGYLPTDYAGNTLEEIEQMVSSSLKKGYGASRRKEDRISAAQVATMILSTSETSLFHTPQSVGFVALTEPGAGTICHPVHSKAVKAWVRLRYHAATGKPIRREALTEVLDLLEARAIYEAPEEEVHVRLSGANGYAYYDLGRSDAPLVKISPTGWSLVIDGPRHFFRPDGFAPQAVPVGGGDLNALRDLLQLDEKNWILLLAFLIICLKPNHPYMVLLLSGEQGSGKSKISELVKRIIDPNALEKLRLPKDEHTLAIQAAMTRLLVYDNTSGVRWDLSDALCALLTGGGFSTRKYYTDDEQRMFKNARPVIINGIGEFASQPDLLDRAIAIRLPPMPAGSRLTEKAINTKFEAILPGVLGCLFDIVSMALRRFDEVEPPTTFRMADAAQWLIAAEPATGLRSGIFVRALEASVRDLTIENTLNHPLVLVILKILDLSGPKRHYEGTMGDLHDQLRDDHGRIDRQLPQTPSHLSTALQRLAPGMAEVGIMVELQSRTRTARPLRIWIEANEFTPDPSERSEMVRKIYRE